MDNEDNKTFFCLSSFYGQIQVMHASIDESPQLILASAPIKSLPSYISYVARAGPLI